MLAVMTLTSRSSTHFLHFSSSSTSVLLLGAAPLPFSLHPCTAQAVRGVQGQGSVGVQAGGRAVRGVQGQGSVGVQAGRGRGAGTGWS